MRASRTFEPHADQVAEVRRFVVSELSTWGASAGDVALLASELATNAVLHARSRFSVTVVLASGRIRVEVSDRNPTLPTLSPVRPDACDGRGLALVQTLAAAWGVDPHAEHGKTVWFELDSGPVRTA
jgi:anti-sigma regulatory factor (Ser/Thr protein kinase)